MTPMTQNDAFFTLYIFPSGFCCKALNRHLAPEDGSVWLQTFWENDFDPIKTWNKLIMLLNQELVGN